MDIYEELGLIEIEPSAVFIVLDDEEHIFLILDIGSGIDWLDDNDVGKCKALKYYMKVVK